MQENNFLTLFNPLIMYDCKSTDELRIHFTIAKTLCFALSIGLSLFLGHYFNMFNYLMGNYPIYDYIGYIISIPLSFFIGFSLYQNLFVKNKFQKPTNQQKTHILHVLQNNYEAFLYTLSSLDDKIISPKMKQTITHEPYSENSLDIIFHTWHKIIHYSIYEKNITN